MRKFHIFPPPDDGVQRKLFWAWNEHLEIIKTLHWVLKFFASVRHLFPQKIGCYSMHAIRQLL